MVQEYACVYPTWLEPTPPLAPRATRKADQVAIFAYGGLRLTNFLSSSYWKVADVAADIDRIRSPISIPWSASRVGSLREGVAGDLRLAPPKPASVALH